MLHLEPDTYQEAITSKESGMWSTAMGKDIESLHKNNTWELVKPPERRKVVGLAHHDLELEELDVKTAFLHSDLEEEIYMSQPEGFVHGFRRSAYDCCVYHKKAPSGSLIYLLLYVDDMLVVAKDIAEAGYSSRDESCVTIYAHPGKENWNAVKHIFCYFKGTSDVGLIYGGDHEYLVVRYLDSNYDADLDARRSLTGYVFTIENSVVSWKSTLHPLVALSTTKAEYMALTEATKEGIWLKGLIEDFGFPQDQATAFYDSMSAICLAKDQVYHDQTKHIDVLYHFIRIERRIKVKKIDTQNNPADVFTKPVKCKYVTRNRGKGRKNEENTDSYKTLQTESSLRRNIDIGYAVNLLLPMIWKVVSPLQHHGFVGYPFDYRVTLGFGSIVGGLDHVNPVIRLPLEHGISRVLGLDDYCNPSTDDEDAYEHVWRVFEIIDLFHFPGVTHDAIMLRVFPITLKGWALRWKKASSRSKGNMKEPVPGDLLPMSFLRHLNEQICSPYKTRKTVCMIENPGEVYKMKAREDEGDMDVSWDITVEDVERLRQFITPTMYTLPNLKPVVQPYMSLGPVHDKEEIVREEEQDYVPRAVLMKSGLVSVNTARQVNVAHTKTTVNDARSMAYLSKIAHSTVKRPIHKNTAFKNSNFNQRVNSVKDKKFNTARPKEVVYAARPKAVVNAIKGNNVNAIKASACWVWKPNTKVLDHVSKHNSALITLKKFDYVDEQGRSKSDKGVTNSGCSRHMTRNMSYLIDYKEIDGGYVAFGGNPKGGKITGKGTIKTGNLDFVNVYFAEAVNTACYVQNRVLVTKPHNKTPYELFLGRQPALGFMRPFGCLVTILNTIDHFGKFNGKADEGLFIGYSINSKAFRVFNSRNRIVEENLHVQFSENTPNIARSTKACDDAGNNEKKVTEEPGKEGGDSSKDDESYDQEKEDNVNSTNTVNAASTNEVNVVGAKTSIELPDDLNMPELEDIVYSDGDEDVGAKADMNNLDVFMPVSPIPTIRIHKDHPVEQIIKDLTSASKTRRMIKNLEEHKNQKRNKKDEREIVIKNKARLVTKGYTQEEGIDYDEVFSPVATIKAIRLFLAYDSFKDFVVYQMDVKSAFLYGKIEEEVYVCQTPGFEDPDFPDRVYKVEKALYGLHLVLRAWYETLSTYLLDNGFQRGKIDKTLLIR
ncbi:retrovirus-related pol polyprotein from transposon TNT 1-94 [Tanacetum coccineum]